MKLPIITNPSARMNKIIALIPARLEATRFPGKLLKVLEGKSIILRTYEAVCKTNLFDDVYVVCDHELIYQEIATHGGKAIMSLLQHESGTDRIAEAAEKLDADIFVNIQGDEPFIDKQSLEKVIQLFENRSVQIASLKMKIEDIEKINNPNCVKVVTDKFGKALYFSRAAIPFNRSPQQQTLAYQHIGVYAFRKDALLQLSKLPVSELENIEKLENLRMLENGIPIHLAEVHHVGISIDTELDFIKAQEYLSQKKS